MKKLLMVVLTVAMIAFCILPAMAENGGVWVSLGYIGTDGEKSKEGGLQFGGGFRKDHWGIEAGMALYPDYKGINPNPYTQDENYATYDKYKSTSYGVDVLYFYDITDKLIATGGLGIYFTDKKLVLRENSTGMLYDQGISTETNLAYSIGGQYKINDAFSMGLSYHTIRGLNFRFIHNF